MKNVKCVLEFLYRNGSKNPRELCERTGFSLATVYRKIGRIRNGESLEIKKGRGRPQKSSASQKKAITQIALRNPLFSAADVKNCFEKSHKHSVSSRTYHRTLLRSGISKKMPKKVPNISQQQEIKRLDFCKQFNLPGFFDNVFLTDESTFQLHRNTVKVWSSKNSSYPKKKVPKFSKKIMVWGALSKKGFFMHIYQNNANDNSEFYQDPLVYFIPYANKLYPDSWILEQDGATPHTAASTRDYLSGHGIQLLQSPPNSPDLWTIETVWQIFKHEIEKKNPKNLDELTQYAWDCRTILDLKTRKKLIDATYERFSKCVKNEGKLVKY